MKNVNLTNLYLNLLAKCHITNLNVSSIIKIDDKEPIDVMIRCNIEDTNNINLDEVSSIFKSNIIGEVKQATIRLRDNYLQLYIEFLGNDDSHWDKLS